MWLELVLGMLFQGAMDGAVSEQISRRTRIFCIIFSSLRFLLVILCLFVGAFLVEDQSLVKRGTILVIGLGILAYYLHFLGTVIGRKRGRRRTADSGASSCGYFESSSSWIEKFYIGNISGSGQTRDYGDFLRGR